MSQSRLLFCAPASGGGKTTVTCAVLQALVNRGLRPVSFKSGPDYIDPMFHSQVIGATARNLDLFLLGEAAVLHLLAENGAKGDVAIIEGAMGYYDGIAMSSEASAWDLARTTRTPAVLVVDARGRARSAAPLVKGFCAFEQESRIQGVVLDRISPMLYPRLKECIEQETGVRVYGFLPERPDCAVESRHLGLVTAAEISDLKERLQRLAEQAEESIDLDGLLALAASAEALPEGSFSVPEPVPGKPRIAVARDKAFCFYYAGGLKLLEQCGAELVNFSPLEDEELPEGCSGLYLGGGYPELYGKELAANASMLAAIRRAIRSGMPTVAECGGFLYLHQTLGDADGQHDWPLVGVIPERAWNTGKLSRFGYVTLKARFDSLLFRAGEEIPAHEFHYWESGDPGAAFRAEKPQSSRGWDCGHASPALYAGFPHFHFCAKPETAARFVSAARSFSWKKKNQKEL
ncbi:MAG: cobyrinate a,c-diamide synthase [Oscillospiraceae bacterium]|nr:cobyrinate a,c-diamide synthase [Oscillospiraceae bacterium]